MEFWGYAIVFLVILIVIFLICREVNCWYWKINERRDLLESINNYFHNISSSDNSKEQKEIIRLLNNINFKLSELNISCNQNNTMNDNNQENSNSIKKEESSEYTIKSINGRSFATKGNKLFCPKCHSSIDSDSYSMCPNCGKDFME